MLLLRICLYLVCFVSITWSTLVFAGPAILAALISSYSNNQLVATSITVTPKLDVKIGRLNYTFKNSDGLISNKGFSRSIKLSWSLFDNSPFLQADFGPTVFESSFSADYMSVYTSAFSGFNFSDLLLKGSVDNLNLQSGLKSERLNFEAFFRKDTLLLEGLAIVVPIANLDAPHLWSLSNANLHVKEIDLSIPLDEQAIIIEVSAEEIKDPKTETKMLNLDGLLNVTKDDVGFQIDIQSSNFFGIEQRLGRIVSEGNYSRGGYLKKVYLESIGTKRELADGSPSNVVIDISKSEADNYEIEIMGVLEPIDLSLGGNFIGSIPANKFEVESSLEGEFNEIDAFTQIKLQNADFPPINAIGDLRVKFDTPLFDLDCVKLDCKISQFSFDYKISVDGEWFVGSTFCSSSPCSGTSLSHHFKTSNTSEIFNTINQVNILNPLYTFYLYSLVVAGKKVGNGHEVKIN